MSEQAPERDRDVLALIHADAVRAVETQASRLSEVRARAATLLTAASITAAFLAPRVFNGRTSAYAWVGVAAFAAVAVTATLVLWPWLGWRLYRHPSDLLKDYGNETDSLSQTLYDLTYHLGTDTDANAKLLRRLSRFLAAGCISLSAEVILFLFDLRIRR